MTRDEARLKIAAATRPAPDYPMIDFFINASVALGMLEVQEPDRRVGTRLARAVVEWQAKGGMIMDFVERAGLEVSEKV